MNPLFTSLVADVITLTKREDLVAETALAIRAATLKAHNSEDFVKDIVETSIQFTASDYFQSLDYKQLYPLWKKPKYIRKYDASGSAPGALLTPYSPEQSVDLYKTNRVDIYYTAGSVLQIRTKEQQQYFLAAYYTHPNVMPDTYDSWVGRDYPFAVVYEAAATVFKATGFDEQVSTFRELVKEQYAELKMHEIEQIGT